MVKVDVLDSDGVFRGGLFNTDVYHRFNSLVWEGRPRLDHTEYLYDIGYGSWYLYLEADKPCLSGSARCDDLFDSKSKAIKLTPQDALKWFKKQGIYDPPERLIEQAKKPVHRDIGDLVQSKHVDEKWPERKTRKRRRSKKWVSLKEYCEETGVPSSTVHDWKNKIKPEDCKKDRNTNEITIKRKALDLLFMKWKERRNRRNTI